LRFDAAINPLCAVFCVNDFCAASAIFDAFGIIFNTGTVSVLRFANWFALFAIFFPCSTEFHFVVFGTNFDCLDAFDRRFGAIAIAAALSPFIAHKLPFAASLFPICTVFEIENFKAMFASFYTFGFILNTSTKFILFHTHWLSFCAVCSPLSAEFLVIVFSTNFDFLSALYASLQTYLPACACWGQLGQQTRQWTGIDFWNNEKGQNNGSD
jgi:hypothetical protein